MASALASLATPGFDLSPPQNNVDKESEDGPPPLITTDDEDEDEPPPLGSHSQSGLLPDSQSGFLPDYNYQSGLLPDSHDEPPPVFGTSSSRICHKAMFLLVTTLVNDVHALFELLDSNCTFYI